MQKSEKAAKLLRVTLPQQTFLTVSDNLNMRAECCKGRRFRGERKKDGAGVWSVVERSGRCRLNDESDTKYISRDLKG